MGVNRGSFTELVFTLPKGMWGKARPFYSRLTALLSLTKGIDKSKWHGHDPKWILYFIECCCVWGSQIKLVNEKLDTKHKYTSNKNNW